MSKTLIIFNLEVQGLQSRLGKKSLERRRLFLGAE